MKFSLLEKLIANIKPLRSVYKVPLIAANTKRQFVQEFARGLRELGYKTKSKGAKYRHLRRRSGLEARIGGRLEIFCIYNIRSRKPEEEEMRTYYHVLDLMCKYKAQSDGKAKTVAPNMLFLNHSKDELVDSLKCLLPYDGAFKMNFLFYTPQRKPKARKTLQALGGQEQAYEEAPTQQLTARAPVQAPAQPPSQAGQNKQPYSTQAPSCRQS